MRKVVNTLNFDDFKDREGDWVGEFSKTIDGVLYRYFTRSGKLWNAINKRTNPKGAISRETGRYKTSNNRFKDYQTFASWCQNQLGYWNKEANGNYWSIDKDILIKGNKDYSPDACCFVPAVVNTALLSRASSRGDLPIGVSWDKVKEKYTVHTSRNGFCGRYEDPQEAHKAWQQQRVVEILEISKTQGIHPNVSKALREFAFSIERDLIFSRETKMY